VERGQTIRIHLSLASETFSAQSWNVVGEFPGASDEVILFGGHLDSWDVGTGASDDGAGSAIAVGAVRLAAQGVALKRTVRVVLWGGEEIDVAGAPYAADVARARRIVAAGESDSGSERLVEVALPVAIAANPPTGLAEALAPLDVHLSDKPASFGGTDTVRLHYEGVPAVSAHNNAKLYLHWQHSEDDTLDKIVPAELNQNVATWALVLRSLATTDRQLRPQARE
jgi:Zn-dependent M28 family amino/carboxypeptidase